MFTPQEIQEKTFVKAVFGGYDMATVDEFLEPLTEDYITLYKENAVLKSKMKVLVEKLEEYRSQEQTMRKALLSAQQTADAIVAEAEKKYARIMSEAQDSPVVSTQVAQVEAEETPRINCAKQTALSFIALVERDIRGHLDLLESLKSRDLTLEDVPQPPRQKPFNYDKQDSSPAETPQDIAREIQKNISRMMNGQVTEEGSVSHADGNTIKFTNLQFGKNYDPTNG